MPRALTAEPYAGGAYCTARGCGAGDQAAPSVGGASCAASRRRDSASCARSSTSCSEADLDAVSAALLGAIERLVGLRQQRRDVEQAVLGDHHAHADGAADRDGRRPRPRRSRTTAGCARRSPGLCRGRRRRARWRTPRRRAGRSGRTGPSLALATSAKTCSTWSPTAWPKRSLIDLKWSRSASSTAAGRGSSASCRSPSRVGRFEEGAAVGDAGQRIDQRRGLVAQLGALLRHRQQDEGDGDGEQQRLEAQHRQPHAVEHLVGRRPRQHLRRAACAAGTARHARTA